LRAPRYHGGGAGEERGLKSGGAIRSITQKSVEQGEYKRRKGGVRYRAVLLSTARNTGGGRGTYTEQRARGPEKARRVFPEKGVEKK